MFFRTIISSNLGNVGLKTRSQGPKKILVYTVGHIRDQVCYTILWCNIIFHSTNITYTLVMVIYLSCAEQS